MAFLSSAVVSSSTLTPLVVVDLHPYGFPAGSGPNREVLFGLFYLSNDRLGLFFDLQQPGLGSISKNLRIATIDTRGQLLATRSIAANPRAMDIAPGPGSGVLFGRAGQMDLYDGATLQLVRSTPLSPETTGLRFNRALNQLVETTLDEKQGTRTARFLEGGTLQETATLTYPIQSVVVFGQRQLAYDVVGNCVGAGHVESADRKWPSLANLPACDVLAFIGSDALAYAFEGRLYVMGSTGKRLATLRIPAPDTSSSPRFIGLSDDCTRLAISAVKKKHFSRGGTYYREAFVYDIRIRRLLLRYPLPLNAGTAALSPDGHQLATIEQGVLKLTPIP